MDHKALKVNIEYITNYWYASYTRKIKEMQVTPQKVRFKKSIQLTVKDDRFTIAIISPTTCVRKSTKANLLIKQTSNSKSANMINQISTKLIMMMI